MFKKSSSARLVLILMAMMSLLVGCDLGAEKSFRVASDWSRGATVGTSALSNPVSLCVDAGGSPVHLAWVTEGESSELLHYVQLNERADVVVDRDLEVPARHPHRLQLLSDGRGGTHLFWMDSLEGALGLYYMRLTSEGQPASYPIRLSPVDVTVGSFSTGPNARGEIEVFWSSEDGDHPGIYNIILDSWGSLVSPNALIREGGHDPHFALAGDGTLHLTWMQKPSYEEHEIYYSTLSPVDATFQEATQVGFYNAGTGQVGYPPRIGLTNDTVYIFWSVERRGGGLTPPAAESFYVASSGGEMEFSQAKLIGIPRTTNPSYSRVEGELSYSELAAPVGGTAAVYANSPFVYQVALVSPDGPKLPAAFATQLSTRNQDLIQITLTIWADGAMEGYQVAARTRSISLRPVLAVDSLGDFHLTWIDTGGFGKYQVYYATTSPEAKAVLNRITTRDVFSGVFNVLWGLGQAVSFFPVFFFWLLPPLVWIAVFSYIRVDDDLTRTPSKVALGIAFTIYFFTKFFVLPAGFMSYVPFIDQIPPPFDEWLMIGLPLIVLGLAILGSLLHARRSETKSLFAAFLVFALIDGVVSLSIYVPAYLGG
ncbi:MAG: hypothetical protein ABIK79_16515 [Chloroflexota bacterium]